MYLFYLYLTCLWVRETILALYLFIFTFWVRNQWPHCWLWICIMQNHCIFQYFFFLLPDCFCLTHCTSCSASEEWFPSWKDCGYSSWKKAWGRKGYQIEYLNIFLECFYFHFFTAFSPFFATSWFSYAFPLNAVLKGLPVKSFSFVFLHTHLAALLLHSGISWVNCS